MTQAGENLASLGLKLLSDGQWEMDGKGPLPSALAARFTWAGAMAKAELDDRAWRDATWGPLVALIVWPFPDGSRHTVAVCQKGMQVWLPENLPPYDVEGIHPAEQRKIWNFLKL